MLRSRRGAVVAQLLEKALPEGLQCRAFDLTTAGDRVDAAPGIGAHHELHNLHLSGLAVDFDLNPARHQNKLAAFSGAFGSLGTLTMPISLRPCAEAGCATGITSQACYYPN